jgi:hypothetical protein
MELSSIATIPRSRLFTKFESLDGSVIFANKSKIEKEDGAVGGKWLRICLAEQRFELNRNLIGILNVVVVCVCLFLMRFS